jgi:hypothetical protein
MELMQKYIKEDGAVGIDGLHRWHSGSDAVAFPFCHDFYSVCSGIAQGMGPCHPSLKSYVLITAASPLDQSMAEELVDWFDIVSTGMLTRALQVCGTITVDHLWTANSEAVSISQFSRFC